MIEKHDRIVATGSSQSALLGALLSVVLLAAAARPARACVAPKPELTGRTFWPRSGEALATNGEVTVRYEGHWAISDSAAFLAALASELQLRPVGGQPVAATITAVDDLLVVRPNSALAPNQAYELLDRRRIPCSLITDECATLGDPTVVATFTTAAVSDLVAPSFTGLSVPVLGDLSVCDDSTCCGPYRGYLLTLSWPTATDQRAPVLYRLYRRAAGAALDRIVTTDATSLTGFISCGVGAGGPGKTLLTPGTYLVRAVDSAGNEDSNTNEQVLADRCAPAPAGDGGSPDSKSPAPGVSGGGGCAVTPDTFGARGLLGAAILLGLAVIRRRRRD